MRDRYSYRWRLAGDDGFNTISGSGLLDGVIVELNVTVNDRGATGTVTINAPAYELYKGKVSSHRDGKIRLTGGFSGRVQVLELSDGI